MKRKPPTGGDVDDEGGEKGDDLDGLEAEKAGGGGGGVMGEERGYVAKKWKPIPEALLEPEHKHFEFLAKRRKGLPSLYAWAGEARDGPGAVVPMRKTKVQKLGADGEVMVYEVLVPEGQVVEGEVSETTDLADVKPVVAAPGTVIEGVGIANEEGVVVAEHLKPSVAPRRNRPPPKKKGGPGRGKKRVTFTNPDGTTYTTIVPNATKIVPEPGQTVTHVAKGEEARADVTAEQAAAQAAARQANGTEGEGEEGEEGEGSDDDGDDGDDDDDREEGELSEDDNDAPTAGVTPVPPEKGGDGKVADSDVKAEGDVKMEDVAQSAPTAMEDVAPSTEGRGGRERDASSSPNLPLAKDSHSRQGSLTNPPLPTTEYPEPESEPVPTVETTHGNVDAAKFEADQIDETARANSLVPEGGSEVKLVGEGEEDLLGNLEQSLENNANGNVESEAA